MPGPAKPLAPVKVRLAPDPWLVGAAHIRFHQMNPAEVPFFCHAAKERADSDIFTIIRITHLNRHNVPEVFGLKVRTVYRYAFFHERNKPAQDISPPLLHPDVHVRWCWSNIGAKDSAAESTLLTGLIF